MKLPFLFSPLLIKAQSCVEEWGQCGGLEYTGDTECCTTETFSECVVFDDYFHQCQKAPDPSFNYDVECGFPNNPTTTERTRQGPSVHGRLSVSGTQLVDQDGNQVILRGISSHGLNHFPYCYRRESLEMLVKEWNINIFRVAFYISEGGYASNKTLFDDMVEIVGWCEELDIYCLVDWHVLEQGDPLYWIRSPGSDEADARIFWRDVAEEFQGKEHVLYELINEPNYGDDSFSQTDLAWDRLKIYAEEVIPVIREIDPDVVLILGTPSFSQEIQYPLEDPLDSSLRSNLMYTFHFYAGTHSYLLGKLEQYTGLLPIFITEFGFSDATGGNGLFPREFEAFRELMDRKGLSAVAWSFSDKAESSSMLLQGSCQRNQFQYPSCGGILARNFLSDNRTFSSAPTGTNGAASFMSGSHLMAFVLTATLTYVGSA